MNRYQDIKAALSNEAVVGEITRAWSGLAFLAKAPAPRRRPASFLIEMLAQLEQHCHAGWEPTGEV